MPTTILLDADILAYVASASTEKSYAFDGPDAPPLKSTDLDGAIDQTRDFIESLRMKLAVTDVIVCMSDPDGRYFRHDIYPDYKGNRDPSKKPENLKAVKEWLAATFKTYQRPGLEADDCMGILATHPTLITGDKIMVSQDKDMRTIPGLLFNPAKDKKPKKISKREADRAFFIQTIVGDTCDHYPGAKGIGPKSPEVLRLQQAKVPDWADVIAAFARSYTKVTGLVVDTDEDRESVVAGAVQQARLARILRSSDWDFKARKPILWTPPVKTAA